MDTSSARRDTIFALASGNGRAAVAIVRVSGPASGPALDRLTGSLPAPRQAVLRVIHHPVTRAALDRGLILWFPGPRSFTGEDCAEFQVHGGQAVVAGLLDALSQVEGCRLALPGEFTRRAFNHGKLDLAAVEGLADLIDAQTEAQRKQAFHQLDGALGRWADDLRTDLLDAQALAESAIDFADEGDIGTSALEEAVTRAAILGAVIQRELGEPQRSEQVRDGFVVTLAGPPNAGKSTLLNALARREAAIVSPYPGTTRDPIEVDLDLGGYAVRIIDTAGLRESTDPLEREGMARTVARARSADLVLWLQPAAETPAPTADERFAKIWTIGTKADLSRRHGAFDIVISAHSGFGIDGLIERLQTEVGTRLVGGETALVGRLRHRQALHEAEAALLSIGTTAQDAELVAEQLRSAAAALGTITGRIDAEDVLGAIFARFCIGK